MKKSLSVLMIILMLVSSFTVRYNPVRAEEGTDDNTATESIDVSEDGNENDGVTVTNGTDGNQDDSGLVIITDNQDPGTTDSNDQNQDLTDPNNQDPGQNEGNGNEIDPGSAEDNGELTDGTGESDDPLTELTEEIEAEEIEEESEEGQEVLEDGDYVEFTNPAGYDESKVVVLFTKVLNHEYVDVPWADDFMRDPNATITLQGSDAFSFVYKNVHCTHSVPEEPEQGNGIYEMYIKHSYLYYSNIPSGDYTVTVKVPSKGGEYVYSLNIPVVSGFNANSNANDISIKLDTKVGAPLLIRFNIKNWATGLKSKGSESNWDNGIFKKAHIDVIDPNDPNHVMGTYWYHGASGFDQTYLNYYKWTHAGSSYELYLDARALITDKVPSGDVTFRFHVPGYAVCEKTFTINNLCDPVPDDISIETTDDGDLMIGSYDENFLVGLAARYSYYSQGTLDAGNYIVDPQEAYIGGGYIEIGGDKLQNTGTISSIKTDPPTYKGGTSNFVYRFIQEGKNNTINGVDYSEYTGYVIVPISMISDGDAINGIYSVTLSAEGYVPTTITKLLDFNNEPKTINEDDITVEVESASGSLSVYCADDENRSDYYEKLLARKGHIDIKGESFNYTSYSIVDDRIVIPGEAIKERFNYQISGNVTVNVAAKNYNEVGKTANLPYIVAEDGSLGNEISLTATKKYLVKDNSGTWSDVKKKVDGNYVSLTETDEIETNIVGNTIEFTANSLGTYALFYVAENGYVDHKDITVTVEGLVITAPSARDVLVGDTIEHMGFEAKLPDDTDLSRFISYKIDKTDLAKYEGDDGISFLDKGTVKVTASVEGTTATPQTVTYTVYLYEKTAVLTYDLVNVNHPDDIYSPTHSLETKENYRIDVKIDGEPIKEDYKKYLTYSSSDNKVASITDGIASANKAGKATITVTLDDTNRKKKAIEVKVINKVLTGLVLSVNEESEPVFDASEAVGKSYVLTVKGVDTINADLQDIENIASTVKFTSVDPSVVSVSTTGVLTIKKAGQVKITATVITNPKTMATVSNSIIIRVLDYTPKLSANKVTLNKYSLAGETVNVAAAYNADYPDKAKPIDSIELLSDSFTVDYQKGDDYFVVKTKDGLTVDQINALKTEKTVLSVKTEDNKTYDFDFTVTVKAAKPTVTAKAIGTYNTFTGENSLKLDVSSKETIEDVVMLNDWATLNPDKTVVLKTNDSGKLVLTGTVRVFIEGYNSAGYVDKKVTFKTVSTKPALKLNTSTVTLLHLPGDPATEKDVTVDLSIKGRDTLPGTVTVSGLESEVVPGRNSDSVKIRIRDLKAGTVTVYYTEEGWSGSISAKLTVKVLTKLPTAKLSAKTLTLNSKYGNTGTVQLSTSSTEPVYRIDPVEVEGITCSFDEGVLTVTSSTPGTYKLPLTAYIKVNDTELKLAPVTLTVKVVQTDPKLTLKNTTVSLNTNYHETINVPVTVGNNPYNADLMSFGVELDGSEENEENKITIIGLHTDENGQKILHATLMNEETPVGTYVYRITPMYWDADHSIIIPSASTIKFTVKVYDKVPTATVSIKGELNPLDPSSEAVGTIKYTNYVGSIDRVAVKNDPDVHPMHKYFDASVEEGKIVLKLKDYLDEEGNTLIRDGSYKIALVMNISGNSDDEPIEKVVTVKVARKAPTVKLSKTTVNVYDTTNRGMLVSEIDLNQTGKFVGIIRDVEIVAQPKGFEVKYQDGKIKVFVKDAADVKVGLTQTVSIKIDWEGDYGLYVDGVKSLKTTTVKLTIVDISGKIKSR